PQQRAGSVQSGGVDHDELPVLAVDDPADRAAGGLRAPGGDRDLLADQGVHQRGFAGVGAADHRGEARTKTHSSSSLVTATVCSSRLRPNISTTSRRRPFQCATAPRMGTWPSALATRPPVESTSSSSRSIPNSPPSSLKG